MKTVILLGAFVAFSSLVKAVDTTPPTLTITHTWIENKGVQPGFTGIRSNFNMLLDPRDETGLLEPTGQNQEGTIYFRSSLNNRNANLSNAAWNLMPWTRGVPFSIGFTCTACVIEIRARDAAGNYSPIQRRVFAAPFPYSTAPNLSLRLTDGVVFEGPITDCRGLFAGNLNGDNKDDLLQLDRVTGDVVAMQTGVIGYARYVIMNLGANTIEDSVGADLDGDGDMDLAVVHGGGLGIYINSGPDVNSLVQFNASVPAIIGTGITTVQHVTAGDITGEGKRELIISGTADDGMGGTVTRIGWLLNDANWSFNAANGALAPATTGTGRLAVGDMNGDGQLDLVMIDKGNNQLVIFKNKGLGLAGADDADTALQPQFIATGLANGGPPPSVVPLIPLPGQGIAVGDVTGDGKLDVIITMHVLLNTNPLDPNDGRNQEYWRLYENRGPTFKPQAEVLVGQSPTSTSTAQNFPSDVLLQDLNQDHFPEIIVTNFFGNSLQATRFTPRLDSTNQVVSFEIDSLNYVPVPDFPDPAYTQPSRLAWGNPFPASSASLGSIGVTFSGSDRTMWNENISRPSTKVAEVIGGSETDSDKNGVDGDNGIMAYTAFVGENITSTLTCINNTDADMTGRFLDVTMPPNCSLDTGYTDSGSSFATISGIKYLRWTVTVPAHSVVVKNFRLTILSGTIGSPITSKCYLRNGTVPVPVASAAMPKVTLKDPVQFRNTVETQSDSSGGDTAYAEEWIKYRMTMTNLSDATVSAKDLVFTLPANTTRLDYSADSVLGVTPVIKVGIKSYSPWKPNATIALNQKVMGSNNQLYQCTANGISGLTEPLWPIGLNTTVNDGTIVWKHLTTYSRWTPNATIALNQKVIGANAHLYQCTKRGISGSSEPLWLTEMDTDDGTAIWKDLGSTAPAIRSIVWSGFDLPPDAPLTGTLENERTIEVRVLIKAGLANGTKIIRGLTTFTRSDNTKQTAPAWTTTVLNPLEITLSVGKTVARPGEPVRYTLNIYNRAPFAMKNCKVVNVVPPGMVLLQVGVSDGADSLVGGTGHFNQFPGLLKDSLTPTSSPISFDEDNTLTWNLGNVPGRVVREIMFDAQVQQDVPTYYYAGSVLKTAELSNFRYNFVGNNKGGSRLFAQTPTLGVKPGSLQNAASINLLANNTARITQLSAATPLDAPNISLLKTFDGDGRQEEGGETVDYLINDTAVTTDGIGSYALNFDNRGIGYARNVVIRDYVPTGMKFIGRLLRDGNPMSNSDFNRCRFYDSGGKLLVQTDASTDTNGNGFADAGEGYTDTNGNGKFDGFTAAVVRSMDLFAGNVPGTTNGFISYQVQTTLAPGEPIVSSAGGMSGVKDGLSFTPLEGYHLKADNLRFPTNGLPKQVKVVITMPGQITTPLETVESRSSATDNEVTSITIPFEVTGAVGIVLSGLKMEFYIPKGFQVLGAQVLDTLGNVINNFGGSNVIKLITSPITGITHVTLPLTKPDPDDPLNPPVGLRIAWPIVQVAVNPLTKAALLDEKGQTEAPMTFRPVITGSYQKPITASARFASTRNGGGSPALTSPVPLAAASTFGTLPVLVDSTKDSRIFVGRCAPVAVKRGDTFNYTIFVGNLTTRPLGAGTITMEIPAGCEGISMTRYSHNSLSTTNPPDIAGKFGNVLPVIPAPAKPPLLSKTPTNGVYDAPYNGGLWTKFTWKKPLAAGTTVTWDVGSFSSSEGGVATLTVRVLESFTGDRIDDNTCVFDVENALARTSGALSTAVRVGTEEATAASLTQRSLEGMQLRTDSAVMDTVGRSFQLREQSCHITIGGADALPLTNGVATIPLPNGRVMVVGPPNNVDANGFRLLFDHPMMRVACGPVSIAGGVELINVPSYPIGKVDVSKLFLDLKNPGANIVAGGGGNIVAGGGGNIVAAGGGNLQNASAGAAIIVPDGSPAVPVSTLVATSGARLIGDGGGTLKPAGGGTLIGDGGGTIVAAGAGNLIGDGGGTISAARGAKIVAAGANASNGASDGAGVVANDAAGLLGQNGASLIAQDGSTAVFGAGANLITVHTGMVKKADGFTQGLGK